MFEETVYEYLIRYQIWEVETEDKIIIESRSTGRAEELLISYLEQKYCTPVTVNILSIEVIAIKESA